MSDRIGVVYDLGYAPYDGERLGRRGAFVTTVRDGVFRVFGIRRGARKKILPFLLLGLAILPAVMIGVAKPFALTNCLIRAARCTCVISGCQASGMARSPE